MIRRRVLASLASLLLFGAPGCGGSGSGNGGGGDGGTSPFGVLTSSARATASTVDHLTDLGAAWVRANSNMNGNDIDVTPFLDAGLNIEITFNNADPANIDTTYGTLEEWPRAGFPYVSKAAYQQRIRESLAPVTPYFASGRRLWVQCENEIGDASLSPQAMFWRGTTDQYLVQLEAFFEAVRSIDSSIPVVLTSFPSETLGVLVDPGDPKNPFQTLRVTKLLTEGSYDAADLHFYGCVEDIPAEIQWVKDHMPSGRRWISTENGGPDSRCPSTPLAWEGNPTLFEQIQAEQVPARLSACADNGGSICLWFSFFDLKGETEWAAHLGLIERSFLSEREKPAYGAFKDFTAGRG